LVRLSSGSDRCGESERLIQILAKAVCANKESVVFRRFIITITTVAALGISALSAVCILPDGARAATFNYTEDLVSVPGSTSNPAPTSVTGVVQTETVSISGVTRSPFENFNATPGPGYGLAYTSINIGSALYSFNTPMNALSILWGSPDSYNTLSFYGSNDGTGTPLYSVTGSSLLIQTFGHDLVTFLDLDGFFNSVLLSSTGFSFEFANLTVSDPPTATPLPAALPLFATGLGALGLLGWRRKRKNAAIAA
jgi:hypothetical protein